MSVLNARPLLAHHRPARRDGETKYCRSCGAAFPVEFNTRGQMTTRALCDACRIARRRRENSDLPGLEAAPRCRSCHCLIGLDRGSSQTHLDAAGRCPACARWEDGRLPERERALIAGLRAQIAALEGRLRDQPAAPAPAPQVTPKTIARAVLALDQLAQAAGLADGTDITALGCGRDLVALRAGAAQALAAERWPQELIGALLRRHHTTICHSLKARSEEVAWAARTYHDLYRRARVEGAADAAAVMARYLAAREQSGEYLDRFRARALQVEAGPEGWVRPAALAERWGVGPMTVRRWAYRGLLTARQDGYGNWWLPPDSQRPNTL